MKKNTNLIFIMLYPYIFLFVALYTFLVSKYLPDSVSRFIIFFLPGAFGFMAFIATVMNFIKTLKGETVALNLARSNKVIKLVHIPFYILMFLLGCLGLVMSIWGIGLIIGAVVIDLFTIFFSGTVGMCAAIKSYKEAKLTKSEAFSYAVCSYIYCIDVFAAVIYCSKIKKATQA